ncbi:cardiolipin synthase [Boudabousia liubingyangii]|uniref:cardiolipin synthase n=1 Tax=Boudabousia liubingyangii TaxID=1921764 RepID=UPI0009FAA8CA|nr:cardiolipin synthase [Boudabousia liubingyangii]
MEAENQSNAERSLLVNPPEEFKNYLKKSHKFTPDYRMSGNGIIKLGVVAIFVLLEFSALLWLVHTLRAGGFALYIALELLGLFIILFDLQKDRSPSFRYAWMLILLLLPGLGVLFYLLWGRSRPLRKNFAALQACRTQTNELLETASPSKALVQGSLDSLPISDAFRRDLTYLKGFGHLAYEDTRVEYFPSGEEWFVSLFKDIAAAKDTILLEYYIIADGYIWAELKRLLIQKAREGVKVFLLYDDLGCVTNTRRDIRQELASEGIHAVAFNPVFRSLSRLYITYRTHQKIAVIDGNIGYTGGCNIGDEYANLYDPLGYWKDVAVRLEGPGVQGLSAIFLEMWASEQPDTTPDTALLFGQARAEEEASATAELTSTATNQGLVIPFADGPVFTPDNPAETLYRQLLNTATERVWMMSPFLIVEDSLLQAMSLAVNSGVDVRLLVPKRADSWVVGNVTRYNYGQILERGVRIFEYSPGYVHAKTFLADDDRVITGSINLDFRSLNIQFEDGCYIYRNPVINEIADDFEKCFAQSEEVTFEQWKRRPWINKAAQGVLKFFAPLL